MIKTTIIVACLITLLGKISFSQDTINFKAFDSLKTSAEDKHSKTNVKGNRNSTNTDSGDSTDIKFKDTEDLKHLLFKNDSTHIRGSRSTKDLIIIDPNNPDTSIVIIYGRPLVPVTDPDNWDVRLFRTINNARSPFKDRFLNTFDRSMLPVSLLMPASLFIYGRAYNKTYDENTAYLLTGSEVTNMAVTFGLKMFFKRDRPMNALPNCYTKGPSIIDPYSFPSGHTSTSISVATMFALRYPKYPQVYAPMFAWSLIIAYGRPYFGMHYPTDLIAGAVIGAGSSILIYSLRKELLTFKNAVLTESKKDEGSINGGVVSFFVGSFIASSIVNNFIFKPVPGRRLYLSPWMDDKRSGLNINYQF